jgi:hypothetical protein
MNPHNQDYQIEVFWLDFKKSMFNYYNNKNIFRPIDFWSEELNTLQTKKNYDRIELKIRNYISLYAIDLLRNKEDYHFGILITNIKRWNRLSNKFTFEKTDSKYHNVIFLLIDIYQHLLYLDSNEINKIFSQVELFIIYEDFSSLIDFAIKNNKVSILNKINNYKDINTYIGNKYNITLPKHISGGKILKIIEKIK